MKENLRKIANEVEIFRRVSSFNAELVNQLFSNSQFALKTD